MTRTLRTRPASAGLTADLPKAVVIKKRNIQAFSVESYSDASEATMKVTMNTKYPVTAKDRQSYRDPEGRPVSAHAFRVYDACAQIPPGKWSTYKAISDGIGSSPRAVGQALRKNPFHPSPIPCHRVLGSSGKIGGFHGHRTGQVIDRKVRLLAQEGLDMPLSGDMAKWNVFC